MHEHVEADLLLEADHALDLAVHQVRYFASSISPLRSRMRAWRISAVCGKEPIVVVGKSGSPSRWCWASRRSANGL